MKSKLNPNAKMFISKKIHNNITDININKNINTYKNIDTHINTYIDNDIINYDNIYENYIDKNHISYKVAQYVLLNKNKYT